jgi:hypothetical protein
LLALKAQLATLQQIVTRQTPTAPVGKKKSL